MRKVHIVALMFLMSLGLSAKNWKLVWEDNFEAPQINPQNWTLEDNSRGGGNAELQYFAPKNASIEKHPQSGESCLVLTAKRENYRNRPATSARLNTQDKVTVCYGKIEARIAFPYTGNGLWPAFWMLGNDLQTDLGNDDSNDNKVQEGRVVWPKCGEIDICEMGHKDGIEKGLQDRYFNGAAHWGESWNNGAYPNTAGICTAPYPVQGEFHLFTVIWTKKSLKMYLDLDKNPKAKPYFTLDLRKKKMNEPGHYFNKPFYLVLNLSVGGFFPGMPSKEKYAKVINESELEPVTALPKDGTPVKMYVDYIKIYK